MILLARHGFTTKSQECMFLSYYCTRVVFNVHCIHYSTHEPLTALFTLIVRRRNQTMGQSTLREILAEQAECIWGIFFMYILLTNECIHEFL